MLVIQQYKNKIELTQSQKEVLFQKAKSLKAQGYSHMLVEVFTPTFTDQVLVQYIATNGEFTERAIVGKKGGLSNGLGANNKNGYSYKEGNALEMTIQQLDKFEFVVTI